MCLRQRQQMLERSNTEGTCIQCDMGLYEIAVAVEVHGVRIGYLICRGFRDPGDAPAMRNRIRHLAGKQSMETQPERLMELHSHCRAATADQRRAYQNLLVMAAESFAHLLAEHGSSHEEQLPPAVSQACRHIRAYALSGKVRLSDTAAACGISAEHLSRIFHQSTGLSYNEYVTRFRLEHATDLLRNTTRTVTEVAHEAGFQSLSQFHRSFRAVFRKSPRTYRRECA
jgi:AraC-like DNA-binding protein